jgi:hypothetical protein
MSLDFPVIKRADLSPYIKEKKNCMDCCNPETIDIRKERQSRAKWIREIAKELICCGHQLCEENYKANYCKCSNCLTYREMIKQAEIDEK